MSQDVGSAVKQGEALLELTDISVYYGNIAAVKGIALRKPFILSMSCMFAIAEMKEPAAMKSSALKKAWVIRWNIPAE